MLLKLLEIFDSRHLELHSTRQEDMEEKKQHQQKQKKSIGVLVLSWGPSTKDGGNYLQYLKPLLFWQVFYLNPFANFRKFGFLPSPLKIDDVFYERTLAVCLTKLARS